MPLRTQVVRKRAHRPQESQHLLPVVGRVGELLKGLDQIVAHLVGLDLTEPAVVWIELVP